MYESSALSEEQQGEPIPDDQIETIEVEFDENEFIVQQGEEQSNRERREDVEQNGQIRLVNGEQHNDIDSEEQIRLVIGVSNPVHDPIQSYTYRETEQPKKRYRMQRRQPATEYYCEKCDKTFRHPSKIAEHLRKHTGEKPFLCHLCGARFTQQHPLKVHLRSHRGEKPYKCSYCDKQFASLTHAKGHEKIHLKADVLRSVGDVEPSHVYACPVINCGYNRASKSQVEDHIDLEHGNMQEGGSHRDQWVDDQEYEYHQQLLLQSGLSVPEAQIPLVEEEEIVEEIIQEHELEYQTLREPLQTQEGFEIHSCKSTQIEIDSSKDDICHSTIPLIGYTNIQEPLQNSEDSSKSQLEERIKEEISCGMSQIEQENQLAEMHEVDINGMDEIEQIEEHSQISTLTSMSNLNDHSLRGDRMVSGSGRTHFERNEPQMIHSYDRIRPLPDSSQYGEQEIYFDEEYIVDDMEEEVINNEHHDPDDIGPSSSEYREMVPKFSSEPHTSSFPFVEQQDPPTHEQEVEIVTSSHQNADLIAVVNGVEMGRVYDGYIEEADAEISAEKGLSYVMTESVVLDDRISIFCDPRPPKRGRHAKYQEYIHKIEPPMREVVVDAFVLEMAAPLKQPLYGRRRGQRGPPKPAKNLDWIIDAVARGIDVDFASPHNRRKPVIHECRYCGRIDKYPSKIKAHMRTHTGEKPYKCDICGMTFAQRTPMRMHVRRHLDQKPYVCLVNGCNMRFVSGALLNVHQQSKHLSTGSRRFVCLKGCGRTFANHRNQRRHEDRCTYSMTRTFENDLLPLPPYDQNLYMDDDDDVPDDVDAVGDDLIANMQPTFLDLAN